MRNVTSLVEEQVSQDKNSFVESSPNVDKETVFPVNKKVEFAKPKNHEKPVKKSVRYAEIYRSQSPRGNQRNWNGQKSRQLGNDFVMHNKACYVCGSFDHLQYTCKQKRQLNGQREEKPIQVNTARPKAVVNVVRTNRVNAVKASACWVWRPVKPNSASITLKRYDYVDGNPKTDLEDSVRLNIPKDKKVWICQISQEISQKRTRERMSDQEAKEIKAEAKRNHASAFYSQPKPNSVVL
ncbi:hypothetical protein Tco_1273086 [Tanacetum coccineum]